MPSTTITETLFPENAAAVADAVREAHHSKTAIYPIGGGTSVDYGLPIKRPGLSLSTTKLNRIVDYPVRDMTITVEAGITMRQLSDALAAENQRLPIDVPQADRATLGGVIATNWNGPRRYGLGNLRDYVIGISAVDGRGRPFKGGGRVVKNVAGYDFCKLLTGSLGTLGVITQATLKLKPTPEAFALMHCEVKDLDLAERLLASLARSATAPSAIELLSGPQWNDAEALSRRGIGAGSRRCDLVVALEGTAAEVRWMKEQLAAEWSEQGIHQHQEVDDSSAPRLWARLVEFPAVGDAALVLKAGVAPSGVTRLFEAFRAIDANVSLQAHAGSGVVVARFPEFPAAGLSRILVGQLQPLAASLHGHCLVLSNPGGSEMTHQCVWGAAEVPYALMNRVKQQFDPQDILNPGRFVYA